MFSPPNPQRLCFLVVFLLHLVVRHEELYVGQKGDIPAEALLSRPPCAMGGVGPHPKSPSIRR